MFISEIIQKIDVMPASPKQKKSHRLTRTLAARSLRQAPPSTIDRSLISILHYGMLPEAGILPSTAKETSCSPSHASTDKCGVFN